MTGLAPLAFPGSRTLAGWWRQLAAFHPRGLWVAHLFLHRLDALVEVHRPCPLDRFARLVLQVLGRQPETLQGLQDQLHLGRPLLLQVLRHLASEGLAQGDAHDGWAITARGRDSVQTGAYAQAVHERRAFHFLHSERLDVAPRYLNLGNCASDHRPAGTDWTFDVRHLSDCFHQASDWKRRHGFPTDVQDLLLTGGPEWQHVIVDHPEHLLAVLILAAGPDGDERLLGFAARAEGWSLQTAAAVLELGAGWQEVFPQLAEDPPLALWRHAWRAWALQRGLHPAEIDACRLERHDHRLHILTSRSMVERLRVMRSDALKGEAWVLAGEGATRAAALLEMVESAAEEKGGRH